jgi:hypothetical protein
MTREKFRTFDAAALSSFARSAINEPYYVPTLHTPLCTLGRLLHKPGNVRTYVRDADILLRRDGRPPRKRGAFALIFPRPIPCVLSLFDR